MNFPGFNAEVCLSRQASGGVQKYMQKGNRQAIEPALSWFSCIFTCVACALHGSDPACESCGHCKQAIPPSQRARFRRELNAKIAEG